MSHAYRWPYSPKHQAISHSRKCLGVLLRILAVPEKQAFWSNAMILGVPSMLVHILRCLLTIQRAPITMGMTETLLQFQIVIIIIIIIKFHFFCYITYVLLQLCVLLML